MRYKFLTRANNLRALCTKYKLADCDFANMIGISKSYLVSIMDSNIYPTNMYIRARVVRILRVSETDIWPIIT